MYDLVLALADRVVHDVFLRIRADHVLLLSDQADSCEHRWVDPTLDADQRVPLPITIGSHPREMTAGGVYTCVRCQGICLTKPSASKGHRPC
jgi:hypothetical protein